MSDYRRFLYYYDKKTEQLVGEIPLEITVELLKDIFLQYQDDDNLYMAYEIGFREAHKINKIQEIDFDFIKYDYYMEVTDFD
jgi:hypothetical protein